ncbi:hypothetical protein GCM10011506_08080 [Marivirga lumbricoides]|uniref:SGNH/GDSL hydrolase family protein n=1 Tax=Marivirga lumbricoides TaxID=1046115 RepID=A0ABQ1LKU3_9BACT|nr:hypothetical protein GCM10011506_08080 [Marivirga lumbricoides]
MKILKISILLYFLLFAFEEAAGQVQPVSTVKILLLGNSLSYTNNLPELLQQEYASKNIKLEADILAKPNYSLEDHWNEGIFQKMIASGGYNYIIVQQGPSSQADGLEMLLDYGQKIAKLCRQKEAKLVFFMVWPSISNYHTFEGVINNYTKAAAKANAILCPVGKEWKAHFEATKDFSFLGSDGFHPSLKGSQSIAEIIVKTIKLE